MENNESTPNTKNYVKERFKNNSDLDQKFDGV